MRPISESPSDAFRADDLLRRVRRFCHLLGKYGISKHSHDQDASLASFDQLPIERRQAIVSQFDRYTNLLSLAHQERVSLRDDKALVWSTLKALRLRPPSDLLDHLAHGDVIEIYDHNQVQVFRNLRFFELCTYGVFEILVHD